MRNPLHTRFQGAPAASFKMFYKANEKQHILYTHSQTASSKRRGKNLFARLHDHAGLPHYSFRSRGAHGYVQAPDTGFTYDDVEAFRHYCYSTFRPPEPPPYLPKEEE